MIDRRPDPPPPVVLATASGVRARIRPAPSGARPEPGGAAWSVGSHAGCRRPGFEKATLVAQMPSSRPGGAKPVGLRHRRAIAPAYLAMFLAAGTALAGPRVEAVQIAPVPDTAGLQEGTPALLTRPTGWRPGHPAAVLVADAPGPEPWRLCLADLLLTKGVATLELDVLSPRGYAIDSAAAPPEPAPAALLPDLFGALRALRSVGAGPVAVVGRGPGGGAALLMADEGVASVHLRPGAPPFAARALPAGSLAAVAETSAADAELDAIGDAVRAAVAMGYAAPGSTADAGLASMDCVATPGLASRGFVPEPRPALAGGTRR